MNGTERDRVSDEGIFSSLGSILRDLTRNAGDLVRGEIQLAAAEMTRRATKAGKNSLLVTIGAFVLYAGFLSIIAAAVIGLSVLIPAGWAALSIGVVIVIAGAITMLIGKRRIRRDILPRETMDTLREDSKWMRNQVS